MILRSLPLIIAVIPFLGVNVSYLIAIHYELVPACFPYLDGCTSISATGRYAPASFLFRAVQLPLAALLFLLWPLTVLWLHSLGRSHTASERTIVIAGSLGAAFLIVYVSFLGTTTEFYQFMRRFGIYGYFLGTSIAQLTLALTLRAITTQHGTSLLLKHALAMLGFALLPFALGILNLVFRSLLDDPDPMENRIEWIAAISMQLFYLSLYLAWRASNFRLRVDSQVD